MERANSLDAVPVTGSRDQSNNQNPRDEDDDEDATAEDPYNDLGFGFTAYFGMLRTLICIFAVFTVIMSPLLTIYGTTDGLVVESNAARTAKARYTLGNLGFSGASCISQYVELYSEIQSARELVCLQGSLGELYAYGVLPNNFVDEDENDTNYFKSGYAFCGLTNDTQIPATAR